MFYDEISSYFKMEDVPEEEEGEGKPEEPKEAGGDDSGDESEEI